MLPGSVATSEQTPSKQCGGAGWTFVLGKRYTLPHGENGLTRLSAGKRLLAFEVMEISMGFAAAAGRTAH